MKAIKEMEKAVQITMELNFYNAEKSKFFKVWIPKTQIRNGKLTEWIAAQKKEEALDGDVFAFGSCTAYFYDAENEIINVERAALRHSAVKNHKGTDDPALIKEDTDALAAAIRANLASF